MLDNIQKKGGLVLILVSLALIFLSGLFFGFSHYVMETVDLELREVNCDIPNNIYFDDCQDMFSLSIYPFLGLRTIFIWFSYFFIFALILGILVTGYNAGEKPVLMGFLILALIVFIYLGIEISNIYRTLLENSFISSMLSDFVIYNKIMLNFPWFITIVGLLGIGLSVINFQKPKINTSSQFDY